MQKTGLKVNKLLYDYSQPPNSEIFDFCSDVVFLILSSSIAFQQIAIKTFK